MEIIRVLGWLIAALFAALASACGGGGAGAAPDGLPPVLQTARAGGATNLPSGRPLPGNLPRADIELLLKDDLSQRLGVPTGSITAKAFCQVTWPDGSIGVAKPGSAYAQALVPGFLAVLSAGGKEYRYHGTPDGFIAADFEPGARVNTSVACP